MRKSVFLAAMLMAANTVALPEARADAISDEVKLLHQQIDLLQQRLAAVEAELAAKNAANDAAVAAAPAPAEQPPVQTVAESSPPPLPPVPVTHATTRDDANVFNPQISMILNGTYRAFSRNPAAFAVPGFALGDAAGLGDRGLGINESELNFAANVDNLFYASSTLSLPPQGGINVEEAYVQTLRLPAGLTAKGGRFFSGIGYINQFHPHHDDFVDRSLANRVFLNSTFAGDGVQLTWLAPTDNYFELGGELLRGDRYPGGGAALRGAGSWDLFARIGGDVGFSNSWLAGFSWLSTKPMGRGSFDNTGAMTGSFDGARRLFIADLVWKWAPNGNPYDTHFKFQTELFQQSEKGVFTNAAGMAGLYSGRHWGGYAEAVYQFTHGWDVGIRHSLLIARNTGTAVTPGSVLDSMGHRPQRTSLVLGYANSEFSRFRLQYSRDASQPAVDNQLALQYIMLIGAHGAHQF